MTEADVDAWREQFQVPDAAELGGGEIPAPASRVAGLAAVGRRSLAHLHRRLTPGSGRPRPAVEGIELGQVVDVLRAMLVPGTKLALLLGGQARDRAAADRPRGERGRWIVEVPAVQVRLPAMTAGVEVDRMDVDPARARCPQLHPHRQPIRLGRIAQLAEYRPAALEVLRVDGQIKIPVLPGLPPG
jgi:hypothetical protein